MMHGLVNFKNYGIYGGKARCIQDFGWVSEGRRPLVRPRHSLGEQKLKWILKKWDPGAWIGLICPEGKRHLRKHGHGWKDSNKMDLSA